jgi:phosphohistidine phosphatase
MKLYLLRHGIAVERDKTEVSDAERPLTSKGIRRLEQALPLLRTMMQPDRVVSSPLVRARQTAAIVARAWDLEVQLASRLAPGCDIEQLFELLQQHLTALEILIVGHEPDLSECIAALTGGNRVEMKKGALAAIELTPLKAGAGTLLWLLPPKALKPQEPRTDTNWSSIVHDGDSFMAS